MLAQAGASDEDHLYRCKSADVLERQVAATSVIDLRCCYREDLGVLRLGR